MFYFLAPVPAPRKKRREKPEDEESGQQYELQLAVKERIQRLQEQTQDAEGSTEQAPEHKKQRPKSQAFQMFEEKGIIIGMVSSILGSRYWLELH